MSMKSKLSVFVNETPSLSPRRGNLRLVASHGQIIESALTESDNLHNLDSADDAMLDHFYAIAVAISTAGN